MKDQLTQDTQTKMNQPVREAHGQMGMHRILAHVCNHYQSAHQKDQWAESHGTEDVFGRLCPSGVEINPSEIPQLQDALRALANDIALSDDEATAADGPADAGIAFLGQFIDHDLTLDVTTHLGQVAGDVSKIRNFRTPRLDLDCVFGSGPEASPHLYDRNSIGGKRLLLGRTAFEGGGAIPNDLDLPRNRQGRALIGDPRNDENLFLSQVQSRMFIQRFNEMFDAHGGDYEAAREEMITWYHQTILQQFLPAVVHQDVLAPFLTWVQGGEAPKMGDVDWAHAPDMPVEFSAAAFRFGHSMIRQTYDLNDTFKSVPIFGRLLQGFSPVVAEHNLDMDLFFGIGAQKSRPIDTRIPRALIELPPSVVGDGERNLAFRNMSRGQITFQLPTGEAMAAYMGIEAAPTHPAVDAVGLAGRTPLWFYMLHEAEQSGGRLGPLGGSVVAGTLVNLILRTRFDLELGSMPVLTS